LQFYSLLWQKVSQIVNDLNHHVPTTSEQNYDILTHIQALQQQYEFCVMNKNIWYFIGSVRMIQFNKMITI